MAYLLVLHKRGRYSMLFKKLFGYTTKGRNGKVYEVEGKLEGYQQISDGVYAVEDINTELLSDYDCYTLYSAGTISKL